MCSIIRYAIPPKLKLNWYIEDNECLVFSESSCQLHLMGGFQGYILNIFSEKSRSFDEALQLVKQIEVDEEIAEIEAVVKESFDFLLKNNLIENIDL